MATTITFDICTPYALHPVTKAVLTDKDGNPISALPDQLIVRLDGVQVGWLLLKAGNMVAFTQRLPEQVQQMVSDAVRQQFGEPRMLATPPPPTPPDAEEELIYPDEEG